MASIAKYSTASGDKWMVRYRQPNRKSTEKRGFKTKRDAESWAASTLLDLRKGMFTPESARKQAVGQFIADHVAHTVNLAESTIAGRRSASETRTMPYWGGWQVGRVTKTAAQKWVQEMHDDGVGADSIEKAVAVLRGAMDRAMSAGVIHANPASALKLPKPKGKKHEYLTHSEVRELASTIKGEYGALIMLLALCGLRFGEAAELRGGDIHRTRGRIHIDRAVTEVEGVLIIGLPKGGKTRIVAAPAIVLERLQPHLQGKRRGELIFTSPQGVQLRANTWRSRFFKKAVTAINSAREPDEDLFPDLTPHELRHTAASLAIQAGANIKVVQRMLGHESAAVTLDIYGHLFDEDLDLVAAAIDSAARA